MRRGWIMLLVVMAVLALSTRVAWAAPPEVEEGARPDQAHAGGHEGAGEKPTDPFAPALDLTVWTSVVFLVLLFVLWRLAWKPMLATLQKREDHIRTGLEEAERARAEAQRMREQFQAETRRAQEEVQRLMDQSRRDAQELRNTMLAEAKAETQKERERLHREIGTARDQALQQIWNQAATLAAAVSSKAIRRELSPDDHRRLVDEALAEMPRAQDGRRSG
jgi:F-type H+-transporting ATPase subunit b